ncbi:uncharacterized protein LOC113352130 [Papaver somniferum]|uniref:uncharacterized protein LOC113352130 n=1 Tax=Papaver somniferum TaxID=3469 RepID=UPI000E6F4C2B|nr:uncharacterized protein LOC113352130 [Papaver somniferum]
MTSWFMRQLWFEPEFEWEFIPSQGDVNAELIDLPLNDSAYTWSNKHDVTLLCRLVIFMLEERANMLVNLNNVKVTRERMAYQRAKEVIKKEIQQYYTTLFTAKDPVSPTFDNINFKSIDSTQQEWLERPFEEDEVLDAIKKCGANKAPGPYGYILDFFKACWGFLKVDVMAAVNEFYCKEKLDWRLNMAFMKLIPKKEHSGTVKDFRPLCLINNFYKIISKLLVERIKTIMPRLISNAQVNGLSTNIIRPSKGIKQGNSLSPFLFLLVAEVLSMLLNEVVAENRIGGFQVAEGGIMVPHLQFADDTIIMINATKLEVRRLLIILLLFKVLTGLK